MRCSSCIGKLRQAETIIDVPKKADLADIESLYELISFPSSVFVQSTRMMTAARLRKVGVRAACEALGEFRTGETFYRLPAVLRGASWVASI